MNNDVFVVSSPDDVLQDGIRLLCVSLTSEQQQIVSDAILQFNTSQSKVILYVWKMGDSIEWLLDKKLKSDILLFNADVESNGSVELIIGYVAAQLNSYYFGNLRDLHFANNRAIYNTDNILTLLEKISNSYE